MNEFWIHVLRPVKLLTYGEDPKEIVVDCGMYQVSRKPNPIGLHHPWYVISLDGSEVGKECRNFLEEMTHCRGESSVVVQR